MKLIYLDPEGVKTKMLFPFGAGEWTSGEIKEFPTEKAKLFLQKFGELIFPYEEKPLESTEKQTEKNELKEAVQDAAENIDKFYKGKKEGGEK